MTCAATAIKNSALLVALVACPAFAATSEKVQERLRAAIDRYEAGRETRDASLRQEFDNARRAVSRSRDLDEVAKVRALKVLNDEEGAFEADHRMPLSAAMRGYAGRYLAAENKARVPLAKAYAAAIKQTLRNNPSRAEELVAERDDRLRPFVACTWRYTWAHGRTNTYRLMSDGSYGDNTGFQWRLAGDRIVMRGRDYVRLHGGVWTDICLLSPDGRRMDGKNLQGHQKFGTRIE